MLTNLTESFLPFDLDATSTSAIVVLMAATIAPSLLENHAPWSQRAYMLLQEMSSRGNLIAGFLKSELQQLDINLSGFPQITSRSRSRRRSGRTESEGQNANNVPQVPTPPLMTGSNMIGDRLSNNDLSYEELYWQEPMTTEQLMALADSLDLEGPNWLSPSLCYSAGHS